MRRNILSQKELKLLVLIALFLIGSAATDRIHTVPLREVKASLEKSLYEQLQLEQLGLDEKIFNRALSGWEKLCEKAQLHKSGLLSIADLSQSANCKRLYVIDLANKSVLFNTYVAHGRNSGEEFASSFGNRPQSYKSSLGFYLTTEPYIGAHGLSLRLKGFEKGINDKAEERGIVMHGAPYVSETFIRNNGRLGRSQGCPAIPDELCPSIVDCIKGGSCLFLFYPDSVYFRKSELFGRKPKLVAECCR
jgi:hypothetical protein